MGSLRLSTATIVCCFLLGPLAHGADTCPKGEAQLRNGEPCIPKALVSYLYCLENSGGGKIEVKSASNSKDNRTLEITVNGKGSGVVVRGQGSGKVARDNSSHVARSIEEKFDPSLAKNCATLLPPPQPAKHGAVPVDRPFRSGREHESRFRVVFAGAEFSKVGADTVRGVFKLKFVPRVQNEETRATVFLGLLKLFDDQTYPSDAIKTGDIPNCDETPSCIGRLFWGVQRPEEQVILLRGGGDYYERAWEFDFPATVRRVKLAWSFYQREGDQGARCEVDTAKARRVNALPFVHQVRQGRVLSNWCYRDKNMAPKIGVME